MSQKKPKKIPPLVPMRVPRHGRGKLKVGGYNGGGTGRPPSAIREHLRGSFVERIKIIEAIADGVPMQRTRVPLSVVLPHVVCANCGESAIEAKDAEALLLVEFDALVSASPRDRLLALDLQAKYGLGALKEVSVENVRERMMKTLEVIRQHSTPDTSSAIINALRPIWA